MARRRLERAGLLDRVDLVGGDFYHDDLPSGHDLALLSAIIHQNSLDQNTDLFRKILAALEPGGRVVIRDHIMSEDRTEPAPGAIFPPSTCWWPPRAAEPGLLAKLKVVLEEAGFEGVRLLATGQKMDGLAEGYKPDR